MSDNNKTQNNTDSRFNVDRHRKRKWKRDQHSGNKDSSDNKQDALDNRNEPREKVWKKYRGQKLNNAEGNRKLKPVRCLREDEVGITEYINDKRFFGILKMRYTDFHVNEIGKDGRISKLTNQKIPNELDAGVDIEDIKKAVPQSIRESLKALQDSKELPVEIDVSDCTKIERQKIHECIRVIGKGRKLTSSTIEKDEKKIILIQKGQGGNNQRGRERINWQKYGGEYCRFVLHKLNVHTMTAIIQMASALRIKPNRFSFAGTKDRRGCTTQWFTLWKVHPTEILRAAKNARSVFVGDFDFVKEPLHLGQLAGNRFRIALRNVTEADEEVDKAMLSLKTNGFINYFGLQRFGAHASVPSHAIGVALLQGQWQKAIDLILTPKEGEEDDDVTEAKKLYESTKNAGAAYNKINNTSTVEAELLKGIRTCGNTNPFGALDWTPKKMRSMYMHSYQSLAWNHIVSRRIKEFGHHPIVGDLVYAEKNDEDFEESEFNDEWDDVSCKVESDTDRGKTKESDQPATIAPKKEDNEERNRIPAVKVLTEDDLSQYTLSDVIMPTPGNSIVYPTYAKQWFEEFLARDGLTIGLQQKHAQYSLPGNYRNILQIPSNLSWKIMRHKEMTSDLLSSDIDEMRGSTPPKDVPDGQYKSLIIDISLKSSTYATMALREVLSCGTSKQEQTIHTESFQATAVSTSENPEEAEREAESENTSTTKSTEPSADVETTVSVEDSVCVDPTKDSENV